MKFRIAPLVFLTFFFINSPFAQVEMQNEEGEPEVLYTPFINHASAQSANVVTIPAGDDVEGDFHVAPIFEPEGAECWIAHRTTNNISIVDLSEGVLKTTLSTGLSPMDIAFNDEFAIVSCYGNDVVQIWDWKMDTLVTTIETIGQPSRIELSEDGGTAVVALDLIDEALVIDMDDFSSIRFRGFTCGIGGFSFITSNTRNTLNFTGFAVSPDGSEIANGVGGSLKFFDHSGNVVDSVSEVQNAIEVKYTRDGSKLVAVTFGAMPSVYQIDLSTYDVVAQIVPDDRINTFYGELAMTPDGNRVLLPATNAGWLIRFDQDDFIPLTTTSAVFWTDIDESGEIGIAGGYNTHMVDMNTGQIKSTTSGISLNTGALAPGADYMLAMDPLRRERAEMYVVGSGIFDAGAIQLGSEYEADASYSTMFSPDGSKLLCINSLSGTVSVIDPEAKSLEGIVILDNYEIYHSAVTPDNKYAFVGERLANQVSMIDLETMEVAHISTSGGDRPDQTFMHPNGEKVYVLNAGGVDAVGVLNINGNMASLGKSYPSGNTGISWTNRGIRCNLEITPGGERGVLAAPFDNAIQILDCDIDYVERSIPTEGFPLETALSDPIDGKIYAAVTLKNNSEVFIIEDILGNPVPFGAISVGGNPTRIAYNPATQEFAVCSNDDNRIDYIDPLNFEVVRNQSFPSYMTPLSVEFSTDGTEFVLLQSSDENYPNLLQVDGSEIFELGIAPAHYFDLSPDGRYAAVASLHEDAVYLVDLESTSNRGVHRISTNEIFQVGPNPCQDVVRIKDLNVVPWEATSFTVINAEGKRVMSAELKENGQEMNIDQWLPGAYSMLFYRDGKIIQQSRLLKQ